MPATGSDRPVPGLSNNKRRPTDASRRMNAVAYGSPHNEVEVRDQSRAEDDVDGPVADHLIGDADVPPTGVVDVDSHVAVSPTSPT